MTEEPEIPLVAVGVITQSPESPNFPVGTPIWSELMLPMPFVMVTAIVVVFETLLVVFVKRTSNW